MIFIALLSVLAKAVNPYCSSTSCESCTSPKLNYQSTTCLDYCPSGFKTNSVSKSCEMSTGLNLFELNFKDFLNYSESSIGLFHHPENKPFSDPDKKSPIPTKDRGFYFAPTSALIAENSWIPGPGFSIAMIIRVITYGEIFSLKLGNEILFLVSSDSQNFIGSWRLQYEDFNYNFASVSGPITATWRTLIFNKVQSSTLITVSMVINGETYSFTENNAEFSPAIFGVNFTYGGSSSNSFKGFLLSSISQNIDITEYFIHFREINCGETEYFNNIDCASCPDSSIWPLCVRAIGTTCFSERCVDCAGYSIWDCTACNLGGDSTYDCFAGKNCGVGRGFKCTGCNSGYNINDGLCLLYLTPSNPNAKVISLNFNNFFNINEKTISGSDFDPIPLKNRGYYFESSSYLKNKENIFLNKDFTIALWIYPLKKGIAWSNSLVKISSYGYMAIHLSNGEETRTIFTSKLPSIESSWILYCFTVKFYNFTTTIKQYYNGIEEVGSLAGYAHYSVQGIVKFGGGPSGGFIGFMYIVEVWQISFDIKPEDVTPICENFKTDCAWTCDLNMYYNYYKKDCMQCEDTCTEGCSVWGTCEKCGADCEDCSPSYEYPCITKSSLSNGKCLADLILRDDGNCCHKNCGTCDGKEINNCLSCSQNFVLQSNNICECPDSFFLNYTENTCNECESTCYKCDETEYYDCLECYGESAYLDGMCMHQCPLGYDLKNKFCEEKISRSPYIQFVFDKLNGVLADNSFGILGLTGNSELFYPNMDENDPYPAYKRGFYFTGNNSYFSFPYNESTTLFGPTFHISVWFLAEKDNFQLFTYSTSQKNNFNISIINQAIQADFLIKNEFFSYRPLNIINLNEWNLLIISIEYSLKSEIFYLVNGISTLKYSATIRPFKDFPQSLFYVSSFPDCSNSYKGFIYSLEFYLHLPSLDKLFYQGLCNDCAICLISGRCIPNCNIKAFYGSNSCESCSESCEFGCRSSDTCNLCIDSNCVSCESYKKSSCKICLAGYEQINSTCFICKDHTFYDPDTLTCKNCKPPCLTCSSKTECTTCIANSSLNSKQECNCDKGFYFSEFKCLRKFFNAFISISFSNKVSLQFSEYLDKPLENKDISLYINDKSIEFRMSKVNLLTYSIEPILKKKIKNGDKIKVKFEKEIISSGNSLLFNGDLSINMHGVETDVVVKTINEIKEYTNTGVLIGIGASLGSSMILTDLTFFFNFLTAVELYTYVALFNLNLDPVLTEFFNSISPMSKVPNAFEILITDSEPNEIDEKFSNFGYKSTLLLINSGVLFTIISATLILMLIILIISNIKNIWFSKIIEKIRSSFKYRVFIRIYIQSFFEISLNIILSIKTLETITFLHIFDMVICGILIVFIFKTTFIMFKVIFKRKSITEENLNEFIEKFGTFFEEFKAENGRYLYFVFFITRRAAFVFMIMFVDTCIIQLLVTSIFSIMIILYLFLLSPYQNLIIGIYTLLNECITLTFFFFFLLPFVTNLKFSKLKIAKISIFIVISAIVLNFICSLILMLSKVYMWIKNCRSSKVHNLTAEIQIITTVKPDIFTRRTKIKT